MTYETKIATAVGIYAAVIATADDGRFVVTFPAIAGLQAQAETVEDAYIRAHECLRDHLTAQRKASRELPVIRYQ